MINKQLYFKIDKSKLTDLVSAITDYSDRIVVFKIAWMFDSNTHYDVIINVYGDNSLWAENMILDRIS